MLIFYVCFLLAAIVPLNLAASSTPDDFWQEYQAAKRSGSVTKLIDHVQNLSTHLVTDTPAKLEQKKSAILWFMATGGKNGFRKRPSTPAEKKILENSLIFATILHNLKNPKDILSIIAVRRKAGLTEEDAKMKARLSKAQGIITATRIMINSSIPVSSFNNYVQEIFNNEYIKAVLHAKYPGVISVVEWRQEAKKFSNIFTLELDQQTKQIFRNMQISFCNSSLYLGFKEPATEGTAFAFRQFVLRNCTPDLKLYPQSDMPAPSSPILVPYKPMRIATDSGLVIERDSVGSVKLLPQRDMKFVFSRLGERMVILEGAEGHTNGLYLSADQTEEEFLTAISTFSAIVEKAYI
jgi:hypothetical protein